MLLKDGIITGILGGFLLLSMFFQMRGKLPFKKIWRFDTYGIMPNYSFFAPNPLTNDFRVVFRLSTPNGNEGFQEIRLYKFKKWYRFVLNPFKYYNKGLIDLCVALIHEYKHLDEDAKNFIQISANYLGIFNVIKNELMASQKNCTNGELEFSILVTQDTTIERSCSVVFRSFKHKIQQNGEPIT